MISRVTSYTLVGLKPQRVEVEADINNGLPIFTIVGLPNSAILEARQRVKSAIRKAGYQFPTKRITVNLAPAGVPKTGCQFDLPIALAILVATGQLAPVDPTAICCSELSLDGGCQPTNEVVAIAYSCRLVSAQLIFPAANLSVINLGAESALKLSPATSLSEVISILKGEKAPLASQVVNAVQSVSCPLPEIELSSIVGQRVAKRALLVAAAGSHHLLLVGSSGVGKTLLARAAQGILPTLTNDQYQTLFALRTVASKRRISESERLDFSPPFRQPSLQLTETQLLGNNKGLPGELSLAHAGILFMDELAEYPGPLLTRLRQPLEDRKVLLTIAGEPQLYPADCLFIGATNACKCGQYGQPKGHCQCSVAELRRYYQLFNGPLAQRIDLTVHLTTESDSKAGESSGLTSQQARELVARTRQIQLKRYSNNLLNGTVNDQLLIVNACMAKECQSFLDQLVSVHQLSQRIKTHLIRVARTIADLSECQDIESSHLAEAWQYRQRISKY